ncbi:MAG TPA: dethiobiotin synthase [Syntrophorhabdales bacterium]|nr:dethiobiotin synthase [Syntrophorhabdales bacterium]
MKPIFVTGTDTGVGKTFAACALTAFCAMRKALDVGVMKPLEAGLRLSGHDLLPSDAIMLKEASGSSDDLSLINPYLFESPLAPETASELENVRVDLDLLDRAYERLKSSHEILFIEGAGGVLVPIVKNFFYVDLMKRWDVRALVVGRLGLGTINHTLLTCACLAHAGVSVSGVILNDLEGKEDLAAKTNPEMLARYLDVPLLGVFPYMGNTPGNLPDRRVLADLVEKHINTDPLFA